MLESSYHVLTVEIENRRLYSTLDSSITDAESGLTAKAACAVLLY